MNKNVLLDTIYCEVVDTTSNKVILSGELKSISIKEENNNTKN